MLASSLLRTFVYGNKHVDITDLEDEQQDKNEKYITAQILSGDLFYVYTLFKENLKTKSSEKDDVERLKFTQELRSIFNGVGLEWPPAVFLPSKQKKGKKSKRNKGNQNYIYNQYYLEFECDYIQFGELVTEMEASQRLIAIHEFSYNNARDNVTGKLGEDEDLPPASITMELASITLIK